MGVSNNFHKNNLSVLIFYIFYSFFRYIYFIRNNYANQASIEIIFTAEINDCDEDKGLKDEIVDRMSNDKMKCIYAFLMLRECTEPAQLLDRIMADITRAKSLFYGLFW